MSRSTYEVKETYIGTGLLDEYTFDFKIENNTYLEIIEVNAAGVETERVRGDDTTYLDSVDFDPVAGGGTVYLAAPLPSGYSLIILLANDVGIQNYEFNNKTSFTLKRFENALDLLAGAIQRLIYRGKQAFRLHDLDDETAINLQFPPGFADSGNKVLMVNADGDGVEYGPTAGQIEGAEAEAAAAAASAAAALISENNAETAETNAETAETNAETAQAAAEAAQAAAEAAQAAAEAAQAAAETAETNAETAETNAETAETNAETAETNAAASAAAALNSENAAALSETNAAASETAADASADAAAASAAILASADFSVPLILPEVTTPSTPSSGKGKIYFKDDGFLYQLNDEGTESQVGAGGGGINYAPNSTFESNASDWDEYADAAGVAPVDGDGGSPTVTITRNTTTPLIGTADGVITKDASNRQGEGVRTNLDTIDRAFRYKPLQVKFNYLSSADYDDGDIRVYVYDITNAVMIELSQRDLLANTSNGQYLGYFQASDSLAYRLILHVSSTNADAYTVNIDNVEIGPAQASESGKVVAVMMERSANQTGVNPNGSFVKVTLNSASIDTCGMADTTNNRVNIPETGTYLISAALCLISTNVLANNYAIAIYLNGAYAELGNYTRATVSTSFQMNSSVLMNLNKGDYLELYLLGDGNNSVSTLTVGGTSGAGARTYLCVNKVASDQSSAGSSVVAFDAYRGSSSQTIPSTSATTVVFNTIQNDSTGSLNTSTGVFTVPESGWYYFTTGLRLASTTANEDYFIYIRVNGTSKKAVSSAAATTALYLEADSPIMNLNKGDTVDVQVVSTSDTSYDVNFNSSLSRFSGFKVASPAIIPPTEFVGCSYTHLSQAVTDPNVVAFATKIYDSHNAMSAGLYTVPFAGKYRLTYGLLTANITPTAGNAFGALMKKTGSSTVSRLGHYDVAQSTTNREFSSHGSHTFDCLKGDVLSVEFNESLGAVNLSASGNYNYITIEKVD